VDKRISPGALHALRILAEGPLETGTTTAAGKVSGHAAAALAKRGFVTREPTKGTTWIVTITGLGRSALRKTERD
jgi:hypothetical protein